MTPVRAKTQSLPLDLKNSMLTTTLQVSIEPKYLHIKQVQVCYLPVFLSPFPKLFTTNVKVTNTSTLTMKANDARDEKTNVKINYSARPAVDLAGATS